MFTRSELEIKTIQELSQLCQRYGVKPTGNRGYKTSYITTLMAFPILALQQFHEGRGLRQLSFQSFQNINKAIDEMETPTDEQIALIRISLEGKRMAIPDRYEQEKFLNLYGAEVALEKVIGLLNG
ncbi:hypothetical protein I8752_09215 [Nostocaceae cyanobacterium CENA369]|uniref:Uncharacterized protein n=1 Tax=Dendronalium phyllosphericum CENA369 TaxID=1725256 RepID=A0A8J7I6G9_9NOST|nr:hypothetical protein [Dendronalium phyllosphericum]MBH8573192.1 hypothetical protein [Dendronalium phyllosphericum CENA369]